MVVSHSGSSEDMVFEIMQNAISAVFCSISASDQGAILALENVQRNAIDLEPILRINTQYGSINKSLADMIEQLRAVHEEREMFLRH